LRKRERVGVTGLETVGVSTTELLVLSRRRIFKMCEVLESFEEELDFSPVEAIVLCGQNYIIAEYV